MSKLRCCYSNNLFCFQKLIKVQKACFRHPQSLDYQGIENKVYLYPLTSE